MPTPSLPSTINQAKWKTAAKDLPKCDDVAAAMDKLAKSALKFDSKAFDLPKLASFADAKKALDTFDADTKKAVDEIGNAVKALEKVGAAAAADVKKKPDAAKLLASARADAKSYADELDSGFDKARKVLLAAMAAYEAKEKKEAKDAEKEGGEDDEEGSDVKKLLTASEDAIKKLPNADPDALKKKPYRFLVGVAKGKGVLFIRRSTFNEKQRQAQAQMLGVKKAAHAIGEATYDAAKKCFVFTCKGAVPGGAGKVAKLFIKNELHKNVNVVFRKLVINKAGKEVVEDLADDAPGDATDADESAPDATAAPTVSIVALGKARIEWIEARKSFIREVVGLAKSLDEHYREELQAKQPGVSEAVARAKGDLARTAQEIGPELEDELDRVLNAKTPDDRAKAAAGARKHLMALITKVTSNKVILALDGNELNPSLAVVKPVQQRLKAIADSLKG